MVDFRDRSHCALCFNDIVLDTYLDNYMTVNVEGRQLFSPTLTKIDVPGRDGDIVISKNYPSRDIKVHFLMRADDNEEWLKQIKTLNLLLQSENDVEFYFDDELGVRYGQLADISDPPYDSNIGIGQFTIHCQDPFLYFAPQVNSDGQMPDLTYDYYDVKIEKIEISPFSNTSKLIIRNNTRGTKIILNGDFKANDKVVITPDTITVNNQNRMQWLDYVESDYHEFKIYSKDRLSANVAVSFYLTYRERVL